MLDDRQLAALRVYRDTGALPPASAPVLLPGWTFIPVDGLVAGARPKLTEAALCCLALADERDRVLAKHAKPQARKLTREEARALVKVDDALPVASWSTDHKPLDEDGDPIDERRIRPHVWALGPFGSWPSSVEDADADFDKHETWWLGESFRLGAVVVWERGWGYAAMGAGVARP